MGSQILHVDYFAYRFFIINVRQSWLTPLMQSISELAVPSVLLMVLITILAFAPGRRPALVVALNFVGVMLLNQMFGFFVHRARPDGFRLIAETGYSFPSAHAMIAAAFYGFLAWVVWRYEKDRAVRIFSMIAYAAVGILVGVSRIYLGAHYASDVIAGFCLSFAWLALFTSLVAPFVLPRKRTSLGLNDTTLGAADRRDRRRSKPRHFRTVRRLFALGFKRTASKLGGSSADTETESSRAAHTPRNAARHSSRSRSDDGNKGTPKHHHSRSAEVISVMPAVEPRSESASTSSATPKTATRPQSDEIADLRVAATVAANAAATARRNAASASNSGVILSPGTTGPIGAGTTGSFMVRPGTSGPIGVARPTRPNSTGGLRPSATGPIPVASTGRKTSPSATGSFAPVSSGTAMARRKVKPNTTGSFAAVRTVNPSTTGSFPAVRKAKPNAAGSLGPAPADAPTSGASSNKAKAETAAPKTKPTGAPAPKPEESRDAKVVNAENVLVEDGGTKKIETEQEA